MTGGKLRVWRRNEVDIALIDGLINLASRNAIDRLKCQGRSKDYFELRKTAPGVKVPYYRHYLFNQYFCESMNVLAKANGLRDLGGLSSERTDSARL
jgi:hypothetical protein